MFAVLKKLNASDNGGIMVKKIIIVALAIVVLIGGGIYFNNQSSYSEYERMQEAKIISEGIPAGDENPEDVEAGDERTPEDIALDRRLDEERKKNEKTYREQGIKGASLRPTIEVPTFSIDDIIAITNTVESYMRENPDRFPEPSDDGTKGRTSDPRIENNLYAEEKSGIIAGFEDENLVAWEVKKLDGEYTIILLGRKSAGDEWKILSEGDVYQLRKELTDGN